MHRIVWSAVLATVALIGLVAFLIARDMAPTKGTVDQVSISAMISASTKAMKAVSRLPAQPVKIAEPALGKLEDPAKDCRVSVEKNKISIKIPATLHDLAVEYHTLNAPRVLHDVTGDFQVEVTVNGDFHVRGLSTSSKYTGYHGAGLLIWVDEKTYLRFERANVNHGRDFPLASSYSYVNLELRNDGVKMFGIEKVLLDQSGSEIHDPKTNQSGYFDGSNHATYLRIVRRGDRISASTSQDSVHYENFESFRVAMPRTVKTGVLAVNSAADEFEATLENLKITPRQ